jgi:hypothetical protein
MAIPVEIIVKIGGVLIMDKETKEILSSILQMMREQAIYLHRQHGWLISVTETIQKQPDLAAHLKAHPYADLGPRPDVQITDDAIRRIDALIQKLNQPLQA